MGEPKKTPMPLLAQAPNFALPAFKPPVVTRPVTSPTAPQAAPIEEGLAIATGENRDKIVRRRMPLDAFDRPDAKLEHFYRYWLEKRGDLIAPQRKAIDVIDLRQLLGMLHVIETAGREPGGYLYRLFGSESRIAGGAKLDQRTVDQFPSQAMRQALREDYAEVVATATPLRQHIVAQLDYVRFSYSRLIVPLSEDGASITSLMVSVVRRSFADLKL
jgi:hypothetical protein